MTEIDEQLARLGIDPMSSGPLPLDSLARFELWLLLEEASGRELPLELVMSIETAADLYRWLEHLRRA